MSLIPPTTCPHCGSTDLIRTVPEKDPFNIMIICNACQKVLTGNAPARSHKPGIPTRKTIEEKAIQLCLSGGKLLGIKYYYTEMNKLPEAGKTDLKQAKDAVEGLLQTRGLTNAVKKPNKNGCVIVLIVILLIIASIVYFYTH